MMIKIIVIAIMMSLVLLSNGASESNSTGKLTPVSGCSQYKNCADPDINYGTGCIKSSNCSLRPVTGCSTYNTCANCSKLEWNLANCSSFLSSGSKIEKPESSCCSGVKTVIEVKPICLCLAFNNSEKLGYTTNLTKASSLAAACNFSNLSISCTIFNGGSRASPENYSFPAPTGFPYTPVPAPHFHDLDIGYGRSTNALVKFIGLPLAAIIVVMLLAIFWYCRRKKSSNKHKEKHNLDRIIIKEHGFLAPKRYSYSQIKKMTNSFREKLGEGGFGEVYKGTLIDGDNKRPVAVKILKAIKADGEDFVNEVVNISRTSHVNVVTLLGFCIHKRKRALVYEFMANGSLEKYIYKESMAKSSITHLGWERLYQIALGVARGLEYLHRGCSTRILHFDIKPHNILLDQDFVPKISDFGLAKQCSTKESVISMMETRGTIGYIAPEVISRNFGGVSHKSDVYSYGMMLLEMVGGRKNICPLVSQISEVYFPHWAYHRIVVGGDLKLQGIKTTQENEMAKKMIIVGLWCIQNDPMQRPAMRKVIEMLEGSLESMEIPPKPFFGSPSRSEANSSDTTQEITSIS